MRDLGRLAEHDAGRAVFLGGEFHGLLETLWAERFAGYREVDVDTGEYLGIGVGSGGVEVGDAVGDLLAALAQDVDDVEGGAPPRSSSSAPSGAR
jgi:hypothetical protein